MFEATSVTTQYYESDDFLNKLRQGDEEAIKFLISMFLPKIKPMVMAVVPQHCDDVLQDIWIAIAKGIKQFKHQSKLSTWVHRIAFNQIKTYARRLPKEQLNETIDHGYLFKRDGHWQKPSIPWDYESPEELAANEELCQIIEQSVTKLPPLQQLVFQLHELNDYPSKEICNILDISASNLRVLLHRARCTVYQAISRHEVG